jgi:hypothetical protein
MLFIVHDGYLITVVVVNCHDYSVQSIEAAFVA